MYTPPFNRIADSGEIRAMVRAWATAQLVTVDEQGQPLATLLPIVWTGDTVIAHLAKANPQWRDIGDGTPALLICSGPEAYVSPSWYATKAEDGRVVPTWNYSVVHLRGTATVHHDPDWLRTAVEHLTDEHEGQRRDPWSVGDAPEAFVQGQLRGIVGVQVRITAIEAKAKLSQNRSQADRDGVARGLRESGGAGPAAVADAMSAAEQARG